MKNLARCLVMLMLMSVGSNVYAQNWVPYQGVVQTQTVYAPQPEPVIIYQWVPYVTQQNFVIEQQRLFCKKQTVITKPITQWVLQPVVIYR